MKRTKLLGWTLFACGILGVFYVLIPPLGYMWKALGSLLLLLLSSKFWALAGAGIAISWGWSLSHSDDIRRYSLSWREDIQHEVDWSVNILGV